MNNYSPGLKSVGSKTIGASATFFDATFFFIRSEIVRSTLNKREIFMKILELRTDDENDLLLKFMVSYSHFTLFILPIVMILLFEL